MSKVLFPKRNADGSFCIDVVIAVETDEPQVLLQRVEEWARTWTGDNQTWTRQWTPSERRETLNYSQEFKREPYPVSCTPTELTIRLEGQPSAQWWKDWVVLKLLSELKSAFVEFRDVLRMRDCDAFPSMGDR